MDTCTAASPATAIGGAGSRALITGAITLTRWELEDREDVYRRRCGEYMAAFVARGGYGLTDDDPEHVAFHAALAACGRASIALDFLTELEEGCAVPPAGAGPVGVLDLATLAAWVAEDRATGDETWTDEHWPMERAGAA